MAELTEAAKTAVNSLMIMDEDQLPRQGRIETARAICLEIAALRESVVSELNNVVVAVNDLQESLSK